MEGPRVIYARIRSGLIAQARVLNSRVVDGTSPPL